MKCFNIFEEIQFDIHNRKTILIDTFSSLLRYFMISETMRSLMMIFIFVRLGNNACKQDFYIL